VRSTVDLARAPKGSARWFIKEAEALLDERRNGLRRTKLLMTNSNLVGRWVR
jgi:hypothetical protein